MSGLRKRTPRPSTRDVNGDDAGSQRRQPEQQEQRLLRPIRKLEKSSGPDAV